MSVEILPNDAQGVQSDNVVGQIATEQPINAVEDIYSLDVDVTDEQPQLDEEGDIDMLADTVPDPGAIKPPEVHAFENDERPEAVLLSGVDDMSTKDVLQYCKEYYPSEVPTVEWVDDSSIVLVYANDDAASTALEKFTSEAEFYDDAPEPSTLRNAKVHPENGKFSLKVRIALLTDKKARGARDRSRYYLFHGDPREEEHARNREESRSRRRSRSPLHLRRQSPVRSPPPRRNGSAYMDNYREPVRISAEDADFFPSSLKGTLREDDRWSRRSRYNDEPRDHGLARRIDRHHLRDDDREHGRRSRHEQDRYQEREWDRHKERQFSPSPPPPLIRRDRSPRAGLRTGIDPRRIGSQLRDLSSSDIKASKNLNAFAQLEVKSLSNRISRRADEDEVQEKSDSRAAAASLGDRISTGRRKRAHHIDFD
ncbi:hypothetical protein V1514DRAFT_160834 [Lipomyces japonicus]|uniref:uncharacterized protein n=1 Tax=Lipomyces japonicus TaxID=56871 RepID=UPI0034CE4808